MLNGVAEWPARWLSRLWRIRATRPPPLAPLDQLFAAKWEPMLREMLSRVEAPRSGDTASIRLSVTLVPEPNDGGRLRYSAPVLMAHGPDGTITILPLQRP